MESKPPPEQSTPDDGSNGFEWPVSPELNPWSSIVAYLALGCAIFGGIVPMLPIFRALYPFVILILGVAAVTLFASLIPAVFVHSRACGGFKNSAQEVAFALSVIPFLILVFDVFLSASAMASIYRQVDRGNHYAGSLGALTFPLILSWLPAGLLVAIPARVRKVRWEKCWLLGIYWLSFGPSAALAVCFLHWSGVRFDKW